MTKKILKKTNEGENYDIFLKVDFKNYFGKWVAICDSKIVSSGENAKITFEEAQKRYPSNKILITRVPEEQTMIF